MTGGRALACWLVLSVGGIGWALPVVQAADSESHYDAKGRRDPFVALVKDGRLIGIVKGPTIDTSKPMLYGIMWDPGGHSIALINDGEFRAGEEIGLYRIKEIRPDEVVLVREGGGDPLVLQIAFEASAPARAPTP